MKAFSKKRFRMGSLFLLLLWLPQIVWATDYQFITRWKVAGKPTKVWPVIYDVERWPLWWKGVEVKVLNHGNSLGEGAVVAFTWKSWLPYRLRFNMETTKVTPLERIEGTATGELDGYGLWNMKPLGDDSTLVEYYWHVRTTKPWMNRLSFALKPIFRASHNAVMRRGLRGLCAELTKESHD